MATPGGWSRALMLFKYAQRVRPGFTYLCSNGTETPLLFPRSWVGGCNGYASSSEPYDQNATAEGAAINPKKKKVFIPRVTLLTQNDEMSVVTLEMADKIAARRNLKLVKILDFDTRTERPIYKLMSTKDYIQEGLIRKKQKKTEKENSLRPEKMVSVSSKISEHDLQTKFKSVAKFLAKKHEVRFVITFDGNKEKAEEICTQMETAVKDLSVTVKKVPAPHKIRLHLCPKLDKNLRDDSKIEAKESTEKSVDGDSKTDAKPIKNESHAVLES